MKYIHPTDMNGNPVYPAVLAKNVKMIGETEYCTLQDKLDITYNCNATFVIDSNEAFSSWANNESGNDYTRILVKKGTWSIDKPINLSTTKTKSIIGESGAVLQFNYSNTDTSSTTVSMLGYESLNQNDGENYIKNITINVYIVSTKSTTILSVLNNCSNIHNVKINVTSQSLSNSLTLRGANKCTDIRNCFLALLATCTATFLVNGFLDCDNLTNCYSEAVAQYVCNYEHCQFMSNCYGEFLGTNTQLESRMYLDCTHNTSKYFE